METTMTGQMDRVQHVVGTWADATFPDQTDSRIMDHLGEEVRELYDAIDATFAEPDAVGDGLADCLILLLCLAHRHGISAADAVGEKHARNERRVWRFDPERGYDTHVDAPRGDGGEEETDGEV